MENKILGKNFLVEHQGMQIRLNVPDDHVIIDRQDYNLVLDLLSKNPQLISSVLSPLNIDDDILYLQKNLFKVLHKP